MRELLLLTIVTALFTGCVGSGGDPSFENPTFTQPVHQDFSDDARRAGNNLFGGSIENPTRMPGADELRMAVEPSVGCENCAEDPINVERGNFGSDPRYQVSLKNYRNPAHGCTPYTSVSSGEADRLLASQNLSVVGASEREKRTVGAAIKRVQELNGGVLRTGMGPGSVYPFRFTEDSGSGQRADHIKIGRNRSGPNDHNHNGHSVAQHVHEWAHLIGNNGAYNQFRRYMDSRSYGSNDYCLVSNYADNNPNEQFAEVFTAFVTEPAILLNNSRTPAACRKAFEFFRTQFFPRGNRVQSCIPHPLANR